MKATKRMRRPAPLPSTSAAAFDAKDYLDSAGSGKAVTTYGRGESVFKQGDASNHVMYIQSGGVKLSAESKSGREAVVAILGAGDFFGEGCLAGQTVRTGSATALATSAICVMTKGAMRRLLHTHRAMSDRFIAHMLGRNIRIEEDLIDQLFNSSEKRLARTLLQLSGYGHSNTPARAMVKVSTDKLARIVGTTRAQISASLTKFKTLRFIDFDANTPITIDNSLLSVVLHD
jgi:CRP-like cAMP-binding protein